VKSLQAVHRYLQALPGHLWALAWVAYLSTWRLPGRLQALAAVNNVSRTGLGFSQPWQAWPESCPMVQTMVRTDRLGTLKRGNGGEEKRGRWVEEKRGKRGCKRIV